MHVYFYELNTQLCSVHTENIMGNIIICSKDILQNLSTLPAGAVYR